jgi:cell wall-associated NlpC family hydrolase
MKFSKFLVVIAAVLISVSAFGQRKVVLGQLGQATSATRIYAAPTTHSRVFWRVKPNEYLVLRKKRVGSYFKVLLQNGADGYVTSDKVAVLPYQVVQGTASNRTSGATLASRSSSGLVNYSLQFQGTPYKWGGTDLNSGVDCSGFVQKMFGAIGVRLPRTAAEQAYVGTQIRRLEDLRPGDRLYFWSAKRGKIGHTGIYIGGGKFVNASSGHGQVVTDYLGKPYWLHMLVAARR